MQLKIKKWRREMSLRTSLSCKGKSSSLHCPRMTSKAVQCATEGASPNRALVMARTQCFWEACFIYAFTNLKRGGKTQLNPAAPWIFLPLPDVVAFLCLERFSEFLAREELASYQLGWGLNNMHCLSSSGDSQGEQDWAGGGGIAPSAAPQWGWTLSMPDCHPYACGYVLQAFRGSPGCLL